MDEQPKKRGRPKASDAELMKAFELMYSMVHMAMFVVDDKSPLVVKAFFSGDPEQVKLAIKYMEARGKAIDEMLVQAGKKKEGI